MKLGLVEYTGDSVAPFTVQPEMAGYPARLWAKIRTTVGSPVQRVRWLPIDEAEVYGKLPGFALVKRGERGADLPTNMAQARKQIKAKPVIPAATAQPLSELVTAVETLMKKTPAEEPEEPQFLMSSTGVVHRRGCTYASATPIETFWAVDDALAHPKFKRLHKCV